jgi:ATP-dependent Clp protease ATP-binding subunit ClpA
LVCTEHLLLGLLKEQGSVAHKALSTLGVSFDDARNDIQELMASA